MVILPTAAARLLASAAPPDAGPAAGTPPLAEGPAAAAAAPQRPPAALSLAAALDALDRANPTLAQARARGAEASAVTRQTRAALLPTLTAQGQYYRNR